MVGFGVRIVGQKNFVSQQEAEDYIKEVNETFLEDPDMPEFKAEIWWNPNPKR